MLTSQSPNNKKKQKKLQRSENTIKERSENTKKEKELDFKGFIEKQVGHFEEKKSNIMFDLVKKIDEKLN